jgi:hypothetical protein
MLTCILERCARIGNIHFIRNIIITIIQKDKQCKVVTYDSYGTVYCFTHLSYDYINRTVTHKTNKPVISVPRSPYLKYVRALG